ncbi:MAG: hypothetical protein M1826_007216 [Phylliscum demangeonii]|nr:MAG: hypothetical protein M1826_007216 [Phylliscum demangeonii]
MSEYLPPAGMGPLADELHRIMKVVQLDYCPDCMRLCNYHSAAVNQAWRRTYRKTIPAITGAGHPKHCPRVCGSQLATVVIPAEIDSVLGYLDRIFPGPHVLHYQREDNVRLAKADARFFACSGDDFERPARGLPSSPYPGNTEKNFEEPEPLDEEYGPWDEYWDDFDRRYDRPGYDQDLSLKRGGIAALQARLQQHGQRLMSTVHPGMPSVRAGQVKAADVGMARTVESVCAAIMGRMNQL